MKDCTAAPRHTRFALALIASLSLVMAATPASAVTYQRTFVRSDGSDANQCRLVDPCRSFNAAIAQTSSGGEVVILDTAGYGPMVIDRAIKIIGPSGVYGGISVLGGASAITTGIVVNAGDTDDVILRGLDITGVPGAAPLPLIGIDIQNAGAVHIEKSSIGNFPEDGGACIQVVTTKTVRVYVDDSFLRHCLTGIYANGSVVSSSRSALIVDNTRIERAFNSNPASSGTGLWMRGFIAVSLRNSVISRQTYAVKVDADLAGANSALDVIDSLFTQNTNGVYLSGTAAGNTQVKVAGSQLTSLTNDAFNLANSAIGRNVVLTVSGTRIQGTANAVTLQNSAADVNTRMYVEMDSSQAVNVANAIDTNSTNGAKTYAVVRDSTLAHVNAAVKTRGTFGSVSLIRSQINNCTIAVDHGAGVVRLDNAHVVKCSDGFVNNGSGNIVSSGGNFVYDIDNLSGFTYITPTVIPLK